MTEDQIKELQGTIIEIVETNFKSNNEDFSGKPITSVNEDELVVHVTIPLEKGKTTIIRITIPDYLKTPIDDIKKKLEEKISSNIEIYKKQFKKFYLIEEVFCSWVLELK